MYYILVLYSERYRKGVIFYMAMELKTIEDRLMDVAGVLGAACSVLASSVDGDGLTVSQTDDLYYSLRSARFGLEHVIDHLPTEKTP